MPIPRDVRLALRLERTPALLVLSSGHGVLVVKAYGLGRTAVEPVHSLSERAADGSTRAVSHSDRDPDGSNRDVNGSGPM